MYNKTTSVPESNNTNNSKLLPTQAGHVPTVPALSSCALFGILSPRDLTEPVLQALSVVCGHNLLRKILNQCEEKTSEVSL